LQLFFRQVLGAAAALQVYIRNAAVCVLLSRLHSQHLKIAVKYARAAYYAMRVTHFKPQVRNDSATMNPLYLTGGEQFLKIPSRHLQRCEINLSDCESSADYVRIRRLKIAVIREQSARGTIN
jgi:hypothetical protein